MPADANMPDGEHARYGRGNSYAGYNQVLLTRPRRFGKTLMMSMLESFFSIQKGDSHEVFEGLNIMKHQAFCAE